MKLARTHDMEAVAAIMRHSAVWPHIHDDGIAEAAPQDHEALNWMLVTVEGQPAGVFLVHAMNSYCYEMHTCMLPAMYGAGAKQAAQMLLKWAFTETPCEKMITHVPDYNRAALRFAVAGGMQQEGINRASYMRRGKMIDQIMLGITKKEWELCQQQQS